MGPEPTPPIHHCEGRGCGGLELPLPTSRNPMCQPLWGYAHPHRVGPPLATLQPVTTFAALASPVLRTPSSPRSIALRLSCRHLHLPSLPVPDSVVAILPDNTRHPSHSPPALPVRQWWTFLPAVSGPCCWQMAHNPGGVLVFNRTPVGKRQTLTPEPVVFQQGQDLRVSVGETGRSIRCRQAVAEASGFPYKAPAIHGWRVTLAESRDTVCRVRWRVHSFASGRGDLQDGFWSLRSLAAVSGSVLCMAEFLGGVPIRQEVLRRIGASRVFDGCRSELGPT